MRFVVDIDQTSRSGHVFSSVQESVGCYLDQGIVVPDTVTCYPDVFQLSDVVRLYEVLPGVSTYIVLFEAKQEEDFRWQHL